MKIIYRQGDTLQIFSLGKTTNKKISGDPKQKIVQTYTFDRKQYEHVKEQIKSAEEFYSKADSNCLDCPMREYGKCYTHKYMQTMGFMSMLRSVVKQYPDWDFVPEADKEHFDAIVEMCEGKYVRFGTYGEPVLHGHTLISEICSVASNWTGYTHQWRKYSHFAEFFMASTHGVAEEMEAAQQGWRSFMAIKNPTMAGDGMVNCPASKEGGFKSSCDKCSLCSGQRGKGSKSVFILEH